MAEFPVSLLSSTVLPILKLTFQSLVLMLNVEYLVLWVNVSATLVPLSHFIGFKEIQKYKSVTDWSVFTRTVSEHKAIWFAN